MRVSASDWKKYISKMSKLSFTTSALIEDWIDKHGIEDTKALTDYAYKLVAEYGNGSATLSALMYDMIAEIQGANVPPAELADIPEYGDVAKTVYGTLKTSQNPEEIGGAVSRMVKQMGCDTTLQNAQRDRAQFAWIPSGDTCAFCIGLAANGWQYVSKNSMKKGHAEHIHSNCDCTYAVRFTDDLAIENYDPQRYMNIINRAAENQDILGEYKSVEGAYAGRWEQMNPKVINAVRREAYKTHKDEINEQKRSAYEKRKELNSSQAEEINVN